MGAGRQASPRAVEGAGGQGGYGGSVLEGLDLREPVMVYDGVCKFCHASVNFLLAHEDAPRVTFVAAQSELGAELQRRAGVDVLAQDTVIVFDAGRAFTEGKAATRTWRYLRAPWRVAAPLHALPPAVLNVAYRLVARNRYRIFGKTETCMVPSPEVAARFRDAA